MVAWCLEARMAICLVGVAGVLAGAVSLQAQQVSEISANESGTSVEESSSARAKLRDKPDGDGGTGVPVRESQEEHRVGADAAAAHMAVPTTTSSEAPAQAAAPLDESPASEAGSILPDAVGAPAVPVVESQVVKKRRTQTRPSDGGSTSLPSPASMWRTVGALLIVLAVIIGATYLFRRLTLGRQIGGRSQGIELLARSSVNPKQSLCLVKLGRRLLLVGLSPNHMAALETIEDPDEVAQVMGQLEASQSHSVSNSFARLFQREGQSYVGPDPEAAMNDDHVESNSESWRQARGELGSLLSKVKGLSRMRFRS